MKLYQGAKNLLGKRFERLEVIKYTEERKLGSIVWLCKCDCGNKKKVSSANLMRGDTRSCGCLGIESRRKAAKLRGLPKGEASFNRLYTNYQINAKRRDIQFKITKDQFRNLTKQNCYYCGIAPKQEYTSGNLPNGAYVYNGIDRVDNSKEYELGNTVPCCERCNNLKGGTTMRIATKMVEFIKEDH